MRSRIQRTWQGRHVHGNAGCGRRTRQGSLQRMPRRAAPRRAAPPTTVPAPARRHGLRPGGAAACRARAAGAAPQLGRAVRAAGRAVGSCSPRSWHQVLRSVPYAV